jgi:hypothetical protein
MHTMLIVDNEEDKVLLETFKRVALILHPSNNVGEQAAKCLKKMNNESNSQAFIQQKMQGKRRTY